jgi:GNAT superfamily N-acetyltransferase
MIIRRFNDIDSYQVYKLVEKTFNEFVADSCTKKGRELYLSMSSPENNIKNSKTCDIFVAICKNKVIGMIEGNSKDKLLRLFVDKKYHGKGIARKLMNKIEKLYNKKGIKRIKVWSSPYAIKFYEKMGYKKTTRLIKNYGLIYQPMKKIL